MGNSSGDRRAAQYDDVRALLSHPTTYRHHPARVEIIETHISCIFIADDRVYKLKKPVHFEFVDFSTQAARHAACEAEVSLNCRLAPDVYLGVEPITQESDGSFALDGGGTPVDWVVAMRRLPTDKTLDAIIHAGTVAPRQIEQLSEVLGDFYAAAAPVSMDAATYRDEIEHHVRANRSDLMAIASDESRGEVSRIHATQLQMLLLRPTLFDARVRDGRVIDGHGDLRPEHICLTDPPAIFDCLEFDPRLRRLDVADELSFLTVECRRLGADEIGQHVRAACLSRLGDSPPTELLAFYESYRACVRAKVAALRAKQIDGSAPAANADRAETEIADYLRTASSAIRPFARPLLVVVGGLMGAGKTTLAAALADRLGCETLHTDAVRRETFGASTTAEAYGAGAYTPENRQRVYRLLFERAGALVRDGASLVIDGTFLSAESLHAAAGVAATAGAQILAVRCRCEDSITRERVAARASTGTSLSEARPELFEFQRAEVEQLPADVPHLEIDTTDTPVPAQVDAVIKHLCC